MALDLGDVPTWTATVAASVAGFFAWRALKRQRDRDTADAGHVKEQRQHQRQAQARQVSAFFDLTNGDMRIWNASEQPICDLRIDTVCGHPELVSSSVLAAVLPPRFGFPDGQSQLRDLALQFRPWPPVPTPPNQSTFLGYRMVFTDSAGIRWERAIDGTLTDITAGNAARS